MIDELPALAHLWWTWIWPVSWQILLLIGLLLGVEFVFRRAIWPQVRYALWIVVAARLLMPSTLWSPLSVSFSWTDSAAVPVVFPAAAHTIGQVCGPLLERVLEAGSSAANPHRPVASTLITGLFLIWLVGVIALGTMFVRRTRVLRKRFLGGSESPPEWLVQELKLAAKQMRLRQSPHIAVTSELISPAVFGVIRPVVLMPRDWLAQASRSDVRCALLHEVAHLRRGDLLLHAVLIGLQIVYWFHPGVYWLSRRIGRLRELCCDATVARQLRETTSEYRAALLRAAQYIGGFPRNIAAEVVGLYQRPRDLIERVHSLRNEPWRFRRLRSAVAVIAATGFVVAIVPMAAPQPKPCHVVERAIVTEPEMSTD